jgi:glucosamine--fructose-6-phosphate aminotransferase (isomerizing)
MIVATDRFSHAKGEAEMCGTFAYVGKKRNLGRISLEALREMEYRGNDSWGIGVRDKNNEIAIEKHVGKTKGHVYSVNSDMALGHTRWATHGGVTQANAHPHLDCTGKLALIHNGIIENFDALKRGLLSRGHVFTSETDSEAMVHLIEERIADNQTLPYALKQSFELLEGSNSFTVMDAQNGIIASITNTTPLMVGANGNAYSIASDARSLRHLADRIFQLDGECLVSLSVRDGITLYGPDMQIREPEYVPLDLAEWSAELGAYAHWLGKEMADQPNVLRRILAENGEQIAQLSAAMITAERVIFTGCGTSEHAAMEAVRYLSTIAGRQTISVAGSEFKYDINLVNQKTLVVFFSQSGSTADLIEAAHLAKGRGARLAGLINVKDSPLDKLMDLRVYSNAGPEYSVLSTKDYTAKLAIMLLVAHCLAASYESGARLVAQAAKALEMMLEDKWTDSIREVARQIQFSKNMFVLGRNMAVPTAREVALKIKEVTYLHAEAFDGGTLKHGVLALIEQGTPCLIFAPDDNTRADMISAAREISSRDGMIIGIGKPHLVFDLCIEAPELAEANPIIHALVGQELGYQLALLLGTDPDHPRNLAKSVTVK